MDRRGGLGDVKHHVSREQNQAICASKICMTDHPTPFAHLGLEKGIALRWALRDIRARRLKLSPVSEADLAVLIDLGLIEMRDDVPVLTQAGSDALE
jgi:hypothetical protein